MRKQGSYNETRSQIEVIIGQSDAPSAHGRTRLAARESVLDLTHDNLIAQARHHSGYKFRIGAELLCVCVCVCVC